MFVQSNGGSQQAEQLECRGSRSSKTGFKQRWLMFVCFKILSCLPAGDLNISSVGDLVELLSDTCWQETFKPLPSVFLESCLAIGSHFLSQSTGVPHLQHHGLRTAVTCCKWLMLCSFMSVRLASCLQGLC